MLIALTFPDIGPNVFPPIGPFEIFGLTLGPFALRWYALAYIVGLVIGWRYCVWLSKKRPVTITTLQLDDFLVWAIVGVIVGGRLGYVLFYQPSQYFADPATILQLWHGGMSFHGGTVGVILALILFARRNKIPFLALCDIVTAAVPIGLFLGRLANFVNAELYGRPADVPWAMVFPTDPAQLPRHPSQLYEAGLEGIVLFIVLFVLMQSESVRRRHGLVTGTFLAGYALARIVAELFREPDAFLGFIAAGTTMGQWLSLPMLIAGGVFVWRALRVAPQAAK
jgi:phosphatidylglycerol:prolipoprotein diacylglycerol transferase